MRRNRRNRYRNGDFGSNRRKNRHRNFDVIKWENLEHMAEDILRTLAERKEEIIFFSELGLLCRNPKKLGRIVDILEIHNFITIFQDHIQLTIEGHQHAKLILEKHQAIESAFEKSFESFSSHKIAHILEHTLSKEDIQKIMSVKQMGEISSYPLTEFQLPEGTVYKLTISSENLFYKMISLGIYPGQRIQINLRNGVNQIIQVKNSRFAIDKMIAQNIYVIP